MALDPQQIAALTAARDNAVANPNINNIASYYAVLDEAGIEYGALAKGVVTNDGFSGVLANNFAENKIENDRGGVFSEIKRLELNSELMQNDFTAREQVGFDDLAGAAISNYHDDAFATVFANVQNPEEAWTPYYVVRALNDFEVWRTEAFSDHLSIFKSMWGAYLDGDANANQWLQDVRVGVVYNIETSSLEFGDGVWVESAVEWLAQSNRSDLGNFYENELAKFAASGVGTENPLVTGGLELALGSLVADLEASGTSAPNELFVAGTGVHSVDLSTLSPTGEPADVLGLDIIKEGIKFDLVGDLSAIDSPPEELSTFLASIDEFDPEALIVETASGGSGTTGGSAMRDLVIGVSGNASFAGGDGDDLIYGGAGHDDLFGDAGNDILHGGEGLSVTTGADYIEGGAGDDMLFGGSGPDWLVGGAVVDGGPGNDLLQGGDTVIFRAGSGHDVVGASPTIRFEGISPGQIDLVWDFEEFEEEVTSRSYGIVREGDAAFQIGEDSIFFGELWWADEPTGPSNNFTGVLSFVNAEGEETATIGDFMEFESEFGLGSATASAIPGSFTSAPDDFEAARAGGEEITGTSGGDTLTGTLGNDTIDGAGGFDVIFAAAGDDVIVGGGGNDTLSGDDGDDDFIYEGSANGVDTIDGGAGTDRILGGDGDDVIGLASLVGVEIVDGGAGIDAVQGSGGADTLDFSGITVAGIERIEGRGGFDAITGSAGDDVIAGGAGNDTLAGGGGDDEFGYEGSANGVDTVDGGAGTDRILGGAGDDVIGLASIVGIESIDGGAGVDAIRGSGGADTLDFSGITLAGIERIEGRGGFDTIIGSAADDTIVGGIGNDTLTGGVGSDRFAYGALNEGRDTITDFATDPGGDVLALGDLLSGFEPGSEAAFMQLTDDGADTTVAVDANGSVDGASFTPIAALSGVTGTDLENLVSQGNIEVA